MARYGTPRAPHNAMIQHSTNPFAPFWRLVAPAALALVLSAGVAEGQRRGSGRSEKAQAEQSRHEPSVPKGYAPPAGMCRIWITGVPAGQQPAPTDCPSAVRNRPANGKVLFGADPSKRDREKDKRSRKSDVLVDLIKRGMSK